MDLGLGLIIAVVDLLDLCHKIKLNDDVKMEMNNMATIITNSELFHQMFKCYNCGRKTVSLGNDVFFENIQLNNVDDDDLNEVTMVDTLDQIDDEWVATCRNCGWSDS